MYKPSTISLCIVVSIKQIKIESDTENTPRSIGKRLIEFDPFLNVHSERSSVGSTFFMDYVQTIRKLYRGNFT